MKSKGVKISILLIVAIFCACGFLFVNNNEKSMSVYAANSQDCYSLIARDATKEKGLSEEKIYQSHVAVGTIDGTGEYIVGHTNLPLTITANENYQVVGLEIIYREQSNRSEYIWFSEIGVKQNTSVEYSLKYGDLTEASRATITQTQGSPVLDKRFAKAVTFTIDYVYEELTITPIFDHIYAEIDISNLLDVIKEHEDYVTTAEGDMYYAEANLESGVTEYINSYINGKYYGSVYTEDNTNFYTLHNRQTEGAEQERINISINPFRADEYILINLNVEDYHDVLGFNLKARATDVGENIAEYVDGAEEYFKLIKAENTNHTTAVELKLKPRMFESTTGPISYLYVESDKLYVATLKFAVDNKDVNSADYLDFFGSTVVDDARKTITGNISVANYYSIITPIGASAEAKFLLKKTENDQAHKFMVSCVGTIGKTVDGVMYNYYTFNNLNGGSSTTEYYNPANDFEVVISYDSVPYEISYELKEKESENLVAMEGNCLEAVSTTRGATPIAHNALTIESLNNVGFQFVGFSLDGTTIEESLDVSIDKAKPENKKVIIVYVRIEYSIIFTNYNLVSLKGVYPINSMDITLKDKNQQELSTVAWDFSDRTQTQAQLATLKLGESLHINKTLNNGFTVLNGLQTDASDNINNIVISVDNITNFATLDNKIYVYFNEAVIAYTLTYKINETLDDNLNVSLIMATINASTTNTSATIQKFDIDGKDPLTTSKPVHKIVVGGLNYQDKINLTSVALTAQPVGEPEYTYLFSSFHVEGYGASLLNSYDDKTNTYTHEHTIEKDITIIVRYNMPRTTISLVVADDIKNSANFGFEYALSKELAVNPNGEEDSYVIGIGETLTITITSIEFGYEFYAYDVYEDNFDVENVDTNQFTIVTIAGGNTVELMFKIIEYYFEFTQYGEGYNGEKITFSSNEYVSLDVANPSLQIIKPAGLFVSSVKVYTVSGVQYVMPNSLVESNDINIRNDQTINNIYNFSLSTEEFINLITECAKNDASLGGKKVSVRLDYTSYSYLITVNFKISNTKSPEQDSYVKYPTLTLNYDGNSMVENDGSDQAVFTNVPYGKIVTLNVGSIMGGLGYVGWTLNGSYNNAESYLQVGKVINDLEFTYNIAYFTYDIHLVYNQNHGSPIVNVNGTDQVYNNKSGQVTLFDDLKILSNADRDVKGKKLDSFVNVKAYQYNETTWDEDKLNLYYIANNIVTNCDATSVYTNSLTYFYQGEEKVIAHKNSVLTDSKFMIENEDGTSRYIISGNSIYIIVNYTDIEFTLSHSIKIIGNLVGEFNNDEIYSIVKTDLNDSYTVAHNPTITYKFKINEAVYNSKDGKYYDLSLGLTLSAIQINDTAHSATYNAQDDVYEVSFNIAPDFIPKDGEEIKVLYTLSIATKSICVTSQISGNGAEEFYTAGRLFKIAPEAGALQESKKGDVQFTRAYVFASQSVTGMMSLASSQLANFQIKTANIYDADTNQLIKEEDYYKYGISIETNGSTIKVITKLFYNIKCEFIVEHNITFNNAEGNTFIKEFKFNGTNGGVSQTLTVGTDASYDIQMAEAFASYAKVSYWQEESEVLEPKNAGDYEVYVTFEKTNTWKDSIAVNLDAVLRIQKKHITVVYNTEFTKQEKFYDADYVYYNTNYVLGLLQFTDGADFKVNLADQILKLRSNIGAYITYGGENEQTANANDNVYYNLFVYGIYLKDDTENSQELNDNFVLDVQSAIINEFIKIKRRPIDVMEISVKDKVFNNLTNAKLNTSVDQAVVLNGVLEQEDAVIDPTKLNLNFENAEVGRNKKVKISNLDLAVSIFRNGVDVKSNYYFSEEVEKSTTAIIYPHSLSYNISGVGEVKLINNRGLTEEDKISLIPLNSRLEVKVVYSSSVGYKDVYKYIGQYIRGNNEYAIGYEFILYVNETRAEISRDLYVSVPTVRNLTGTYYLTGEESGKINANKSGGSIVVDLRSLPTNVEHLIFTQQKILLKAWQIVLIVIGGIIVVAGIVLAFIIIRKRKQKDYSVHEKI